MAVAPRRSKGDIRTYIRRKRAEWGRSECVRIALTVDEECVAGTAVCIRGTVSRSLVRVADCKHATRSRRVRRESRRAGIPRQLRSMNWNWLFAESLPRVKRFPFRTKEGYETRIAVTRSK